MYTFKRFSLYIFIILLLISIFQDINTKPPPTTFINNKENIIFNHAYSIAHVKVFPGDTVLSITETINQESLAQMDLQQILQHFEELNPTTDPYKLQPYTVYYFPVYDP
ncbi:hypothetical protein ACFOUV_02965 [Oceanobacillus longus]|uniref:LysM domain-containing protein n=1 Tax=Oceanobacillus longus TaxID=930120 RepID=A0ABV8GT69_9BACI